LSALTPDFIVRDAKLPLDPVLKASVPATVAEPLPVAVHVTVQLPVAASPLLLAGL
jgi:hypothetical protein